MIPSKGNTPPGYKKINSDCGTAYSTLTTGTIFETGCVAFLLEGYYIGSFWDNPNEYKVSETTFYKVSIITKIQIMTKTQQQCKQIDEAYNEYLIRKKFYEGTKTIKLEYNKKITY